MIPVQIARQYWTILPDRLNCPYLLVHVEFAKDLSSIKQVLILDNPVIPELSAPVL